jgi:hypothetical protein
MSNCLYDISSSCLTLRTDHSCSFGYATQSFTKVSATADEGNAEGVLLDVVCMVGRCKNFGFVDIIYANGFEDLFGYLLVYDFTSEGKGTYLTFDKVANSCLCHNWNCDSSHDLLDHLGI